MTYVPITAGPIPVDRVNAVLGLALAPGYAYFTQAAQRHAAQRHPLDFPLCVAHVPRIVARPEYIGRGPRQRDGFELIGEVQEAGALVLVAIKLTPDGQGRYLVASTYRIDRASVARRLRKGFLVRAR